MNNIAFIPAAASLKPNIFLMHTLLKSLAKRGGTHLILLATTFILLSFGKVHAGIVRRTERTVSGRVTDSATGQALNLVSIKVLDKKAATTTDQQGSFSIEANDDDVLIFFLRRIQYRLCKSRFANNHQCLNVADIR